MENLTGTKVYVSSKHLANPHVRRKTFPLNSNTCLWTFAEAENQYRARSSVHNCEFAGEKLERSAA
jgi:hypothetical protein